MESSNHSPAVPSVKRILVLGGSGLLGSAILRCLTDFGALYDITATHQSFPLGVPVKWLQWNVPPLDQLYQGIRQLYEEAQPDLVVNCLRARSTAEEFLVNSCVPAALGDHLPVINISTNAVFPTSANTWEAFHPPAPDSAYGYSKLLGERPGQLTIRSTFVGPHFFTQEPWNALRRRYLPTSGLWTGVTSYALAQRIAWWVDNWQAGLEHYACPAVDWREIRKALRSYNAEPLEATLPYRPHLIGGTRPPESLLTQIKQLQHHLSTPAQ